MSRIELPDELDNDHRKERGRRRSKQRKRLVAADPDSRPSAVARHVAGSLKQVGISDDNADARAKKLIERILTSAPRIAFGLLVALIVADEIRVGYSPQSIIFEHLAWSIAVLVVGLLCLIVTLFDISTYRPRLFAVCSGSVTGFFGELAGFSRSLEKQLDLITAARPETWREVREFEEGLLAESHQFMLLEGIRFRITLRVLRRLTALLASLALVGYGLSGVTHGGMLVGSRLADGVGLPEHIYIVAATFFTLGFGDVHPAHDAVGYSYLALILIVFVAVVYFVLTEVVASQSDFRANFRTAAEAFIVQKSAL